MASYYFNYYPAERILQPRSFVYSCNSEVLTLQSPTPEARITLLNSFAGASNVDPRYVISYNSNGLNLSYTSNTSTLIATFNVNGALNPQLTVPGTIFTNKAIIQQPRADSVILYNLNPLSIVQNAGFGYSNSRIYYQVPGQQVFHGFYSAASATLNTELMRIGQNSLGAPQVGIGTTSIASNLGLSVMGDTYLAGSLTVNGFINLSSSNSYVVTFDPVTNRIPLRFMPSNVLFLNSSNQVDASLLPTTYTQYLRAGRNVGIGTRVPVQTLHVVGTGAFTNRVGIGTLYPVSRIHAIETATPAIPTILLDNTAAGASLQANYMGSLGLQVAGYTTTPQVTICMSNLNPNYALGVTGNTLMNGNLETSNITATQLTLAKNSTTHLLQNTVVFPDATSGPAYSAYIPFVFNNGISTPTITTLGSNQAVQFRNCSAQIDGDLTVNGQIYQVSDHRLKTNIIPLTGSLEKIEALHGYSYTMATKPLQRRVGFMAQELLGILPEAVTTMNNSYYAISYDSLIPVLVEAVRELSAKVRSLEMAQHP